MSNSFLKLIATMSLAAMVPGSLVNTATGGTDAETLHPPRWALAIHGGAGAWPRDMTAAQREVIEQTLKTALDRGREILASDGSALDAVEAVVVMLEDDPQFNAGRGAVFTRDGAHELDAAIMDGATLRTGAVAAVQRVKNPIRAARRVMDRTPHVLLIGEGADKFAMEQGCQQASPDYFYTERRFAELQKAREKQRLPPLQAPAYPVPKSRNEDTEPAADGQGTVGCVALDVHGHLAAATSTGGLTGKLPGRVGDTPICGAGTYADATSAISCTGKGEEFIRHAIARRVAWLRAERNQSLDAAVTNCLRETLKPGDGGIIAVDRDGNIVMDATTDGMPRAAADSTGRSDIAIWLDR